jgi:hypothetical protein
VLISKWYKLLGHAAAFVTEKAPQNDQLLKLK